MYIVVKSVYKINVLWHLKYIMIYLQASKICQSSGEKAVFLMRTQILNFVSTALHDLEMVVPFAPTLKTCLALFVVPMLWMLILFLICSAVGVSTPFSVSRLIRGFRATAIPLNFLSPPSGVACLNCMFGLMQVSKCHSKKGYYYVSQIRSYQFIALTHNLHSLALKKKSVRNENGNQCRDMYNIDFSVISPSIYGAHFLVPLTWRFRYIQWTG